MDDQVGIPVTIDFSTGISPTDAHTSGGGSLSGKLKVRCVDEFGTNYFYAEPLPRSEESPEGPKGLVGEVVSVLSEKNSELEKELQYMRNQLEKKDHQLERLLDQNKDLQDQMSRMFSVLVNKVGSISGH